MSATDFNDQLQRCTSEIEQKLGWGEANQWTDQDFQTLSERLFEYSAVRLSTTTLKRLWGRLPYNSIPQATTLNALAQFLGYENWQVYRNGSSSDGGKARSEKEQKRSTPKGHSRYRYAWLILPIAALGIIASMNRNRQAVFSPSAIDRTLFASEAVASGVPNTVVFEYDVNHLPASHFMIQQSWDERRRFDIEAGHHKVTSMYLYPGYWRAKLLADGEIIKEHGLHIQTNGWLAMVEYDPYPRYIKASELIRNDHLTIADTVLSDIRRRAGPPQWLGYHYVTDFGDLSADDFTIETEVLNTYDGGDGVCRHARIVILATSGVLTIPLSLPGCTADLRLRLSDRSLHSKNADLSSLGCMFDDWENVRCEVADGQATIYINDQQVLRQAYSDAMGAIRGIRLKFLGSGMVRFVRMTDGQGQAVLDEVFMRGTSE